MPKPKCSRCATIAVANQGDVCSDCKSKDSAAAKRLLEDLKKTPKKKEE